MKHTAVLTTESKDPKSVAASLSVDNRNLSGQRVETTPEKDSIVSRIECESVRSMLASIDDLIRSQIVAESVVQ